MTTTTMTLRRFAPALAVALFLPLTACADDAGDGDEAGPVRLPAGHNVTDEYVSDLRVDLDAMEMRPTGLYVQDVVTGEGARADSGDVVTVHYTGWLPTGRQFDSSRDSRPFQVAIGYGRVIAGWDQGIVGMREGGRRRLVIPPALGYGERGTGPIPGGATMVFDVELLEVENRVPEAGADSAAVKDSTTP